MGILDTFRKNKLENKSPQTASPQGYVLSEILQDKNKSHLFVELLNSTGNMDLAQRLAAGEMDESDIEALEEQRLAFTEKMTRAEKIEKMLTKDNILDFAASNPDFEKIINLVGAEKAIKIIKGQLKELAMTKEWRFIPIEYSMDAYTSHKEGEYKKINARVETLCEKYNIDQKDYLQAVAITDSAKKKAAFKKLAKAYGGNFFSRINNELLGSLERTDREISTTITELEMTQESVGNALFLSISGEDKMRDALFGELLHEKVEEKPKAGFKDSKNEFKSAADALEDDEKFQQDWEKFKTGADYDQSTPLEQDYIKDAFLEEKRGGAMKKKGEGWWAAIFESFLAELLNNKKGDLN